MKVVAIIQARMGSTRLPGKVMRELGGRTVLAHVIERVKACKAIDQIVVATTTATADEVIVAEALRCGADYFRGSEEDVLERYYLAAKQVAAKVVVRITSDCPLIDPALLGAMVNDFVADGGVDYLSNTLERHYPRGLDAEVFSFLALESAYWQAEKSHEREHVTPFIYHHPDLFKIKNYSSGENHSSQRWTLDTADDWALIEAIYQNLYRPGAELFTSAAVLQLLQQRPELVALNAHVEQKKLVSG